MHYGPSLGQMPQLPWRSRPDRWLPAPMPETLQNPTDMRLPDFLVLGAQKGGTTTLHALLRQHRDLYLPEAKELHYFSLHDHRDLRWYADHFQGATPEQRCGDITPYYLFHPRSPAGIKQTLPDVQLIALLRDPVERALSQFFHAQRLGFETLELEAALDAEQGRLTDAEEALQRPGSVHFSHQKHSYVSRSRYEHQLDRYLDLFPEQQLLVCRSEDLFIDTLSCLNRITTFLGLSPLNSAAITGIRANAGSGEAAAVPERIRERLRRELTPTAAAIRARYGFDWGW